MINKIQEPGKPTGIFYPSTSVIKTQRYQTITRQTEAPSFVLPFDTRIHFAYKLNIQFTKLTTTMTTTHKMTRMMTLIHDWRMDRLIEIHTRLPTYIDT